MQASVHPRPSQLTGVRLLVGPGHRRQQGVRVAHARLLKLLIADGHWRAGQRLIALLVSSEAVVGDAASGVEQLARFAPELAEAGRQRRRRLHAGVADDCCSLDAGGIFYRHQAAPSGGLAVGRGLTARPVGKLRWNRAGAGVRQRQHRGSGGSERQERLRQQATTRRLHTLYAVVVSEGRHSQPRSLGQKSI